MPSFYNSYYTPFNQPIYGQQPIQAVPPQPQQQMGAQPVPQVQTGNPQPSQIQSGGFVSVRTESDVYNYPVQPGHCVTFKVEGQPVVLEKSMGFSQLEAPRVERYRLVKENPSERPQEPQEQTKTIKAEVSSLKEIKAEIEAIWGEIEALKNAPKKTAGAKKKEADNDTE